MLTHEYTYAYGAVDVVSGELDSLILPQVNTVCTQIFLDEVGNRHPNNRIIMVLDGAGWHASHDLTPPPNMRLLSLPPYSPEHRSLIRSKISGMSYAKSSSTTRPSIPWTPWKINSKRAFSISKTIGLAFNPLSLGIGLLMLF